MMAYKPIHFLESDFKLLSLRKEICMHIPSWPDMPKCHQIIEVVGFWLLTDRRTDEKMDIFTNGQLLLYIHVNIQIGGQIYATT